MGGGRVTDLAAAAGGLLAAGLVGGAPCLWTSADGARWTVTPLPERLRGRRATTALVAGDGAGGALLAVQGGDSPALWRWARPPASRRSAPRPG
jgi:hypothetical protein